MRIRPILFTIALALAATLPFALPSEAQRDRPAPDKPAPDQPMVAAPNFNNATVPEVMAWAARNAGVTWMGRGDQFLDEAGQPLRISSSGLTLLEPQDRLIFVYEMLKRVGLVAMPVAGMPVGTVAVVPTSEAAGVGNVATDIEELEGDWFGMLALEAWSISVEELEAIVRKYASKYAVISTIVPTKRVLVADFIDNLNGIWDAHILGQTHAQADSDIITETVASARHDPKTLAMALQRSVHSNQDCRVTLHESTGAIMVTGQRVDVETVLESFDILEEMPLLPGAARTLQLFTAKIIPADVLAQSARGAFAAELALGSVRIGEIMSRRMVMVEASEADWRRVEAWMNAVDVAPRSVAEAETDEAHRVRREAEQRARAEREAAERRAGEAEPNQPRVEPLPPRGEGVPGR
jgi:type II secretory pathway component GspD/PulD (secretin)